MGFMDEMNELLTEVSPEEVTLDKADEAAIFLAALSEECTPEEYNKIANESAVELELYGLIPSAQTAMESNRIVIKQTAQMNLNREESKAVLRLAAKANDAEYAKYRKFKHAMIESRNKLRQRYASKARTEAKRVIVNARRQASNMSSGTGNSIVDKMDKRIAAATK